MSSLEQNQLSYIGIYGYKSIKKCNLGLKNINVLIGSNGAGKSNFISVFSLLHSIARSELDIYAQQKGINTLFYNGTKITEKIYFEFVFNLKMYSLALKVTENNRLVFYKEALTDIETFESDELISINGYINSRWERLDEIAPILENHQWRVYHFHDTGPYSKIKTEHNLSNSKALQQDASNLAAFLYRLQKHYPTEYKNILETIRLIAPYFKDFELEPMEYNRELIVLKWLQKGCEDIFNASQLSDGTLRFICLTTLLLQPAKLQPTTIIIDEPELGLHPFAITLFAEMVKKAAVNRQIILSTQSVELLNHFEPEDVIVVDRGEDGSIFKRLNAAELSHWIENDYTLGEMWNKNILGGRLSR